MTACDFVAGQSVKVTDHPEIMNLRVVDCHISQGVNVVTTTDGNQYADWLDGELEPS